MIRKLIFGTILVILSSSELKSETVNTSDGNGQLTEDIEARPEQKELPAQYYLCGFQLLQQIWQVLLWNCFCGRRWYSGRKRYRCNWCWNKLYSRASGYRGIFCHYANWNEQITKTFTTGSPNAGSWGNVVMCPKNQYANGFSAKYGTQHGQKLGFNGLQIKCSTNTLSESSFVEDSSKNTKTTFHDPKIGNFISSYKIMYGDKERLWGFSANYEAMPLISKIDVKYNVLLDHQGTPVVIDSQQVINCGSETSQKSVGFTKKYEVASTWTNQNSYTQGYQISTTLTVQTPLFGGPESSTTFKYYRSRTESFAFQKQIRTIFQSIQNILVMAPGGMSITINSIIRQQTGNIPYIAELTFVNRKTGEFIMKVKTPGVWKGVTASAAKTQIIQRPAKCDNHLKP